MILVIGLFAVGETLYQAWIHGRDDEVVIALHRFTGMSARIGSAPGSRGYEARSSDSLSASSPPGDP